MRIGSAEVYRIVENIPEVADSLVVCTELHNGHFFMPLFVQLAQGVSLSNEFEARINTRLREQGSPRHVPDKIYSIDQVPYTLTGKKREVPIRKLLLGWPLEKAGRRDIMKNPDSLDFFLDYVVKTDHYNVPDPV